MGAGGYLECPPTSLSTKFRAIYAHRKMDVHPTEAMIFVGYNYGRVESEDGKMLDYCNIFVLEEFAGTKVTATTSSVRRPWNMVALALTP